MAQCGQKWTRRRGGFLLYFADVHPARLSDVTTIRRYRNSIIIIINMRPSSLGGGRILRRTLSVCLSVRPVMERHLAPPSELQ